MESLAKYNINLEEIKKLSPLGKSLAFNYKQTLEDEVKKLEDFSYYQDSIMYRQTD